MKILLRIDSFFQTLLFYATLCLGLATLVFKGDSLMLFGFSLFLLGAWQLFSGVLVGLLLKDYNRLKYFLSSTIYVLLLISAADYLDGNKDFYEIAISTTFVAIIPMAIAFWYLNLTYKTLAQLRYVEKKFTEVELENILDSEEVLNN